MITLNAKTAWERFEHPNPNINKIGIWYKIDGRPDYLMLTCVAVENGLYHMSISHTSRYPTWDEIFSAWYALVPGAGKEFNGAIVLPRKAEYVNIHPNCFHVWQLKDSETPEGVVQQFQ